MSLKLSSIKADLAKEAEGDWVSIPEWPGVRLKVRSINSKDYQTARELRVQKFVKDLGRLPTSIEMEPHVNRLAAAFLLIGWEGINGDDDQPLAYTPKTALELLSDPAMRELTMQVIWAANRVGVRDAEFTADAIKN